MPDVSLSIPFQTMGEWFLPDNIERRVGGTLSYKAERTELNLIDLLQPVRGVFPPAEVRRYPVILGVTDKGEAVTLLNAMQAGFSINMASGGVRMPERLLGNTVIIGAHVTSETTYPEMRCRMPGLDAWLCAKSIDVVHSEGRLSVSGLNIPEDTTPVVDAELVWRISPQATHASHSASIASQGWISLRPTKPQRLEWYFEQLPKLTSLMTLLAGPQMPFDQLVLSTGLEHQSPHVLVTRFGDKYCTYNSATDFFVHRSALGANFAELVANWFRLYPSVTFPCGLALSIMRSDQLWPHVEFLSLMQALEGLHRALYPGNYMDPTNYEQVKNALVGAIPTEVSTAHRASLVSRIRYGNEIALAKRLTQLNERLPLPMRKHIMGHDGQLPRTWIDTRNYYTHWDEALRANVLDTQAMHDASVRLTQFLRTLYLHIAGLSEEVLARAFGNTSSPAQYLMQLNSMERRRADPADQSGALLIIGEVSSSPDAGPESNEKRK